MRGACYGRQEIKTNVIVFCKSYINEMKPGMNRLHFYAHSASGKIWTKIWIRAGHGNKEKRQYSRIRKWKGKYKQTN